MLLLEFKDPSDQLVFVNGSHVVSLHQYGEDMTTIHFGGQHSVRVNMPIREVRDRVDRVIKA